MIDDQRILEVFYTKLVPEAQQGRIDCYFIMNIVFNLTINNIQITKCKNLPYDGILVPTLKITDKKLFDEKLVEYVKKAIEFYNPKDFAFISDINTSIEVSKDTEVLKEECLIKYVISTLLANASFSDFDYPINFLQSRIEMFDNKIIEGDDELDLGHIDSIRARIIVSEEVSPIKSETPWRLKTYLEFIDGHKLLLPEIYVGKTNNKYQLYGIQKTTKNSEVDEKPYLKQIRKGFIAKINGAPEHYFLTAMLFLALCSDKEIEIIPFLVERWNAKRIALFNKIKKNVDLSLEDLKANQERLQTNITDAFIRYFTKLEDVSNGLDFKMVPFEGDSNLHIQVNQDIESRSVAFNEIFKLVNKERDNSNNLGR